MGEKGKNVIRKRPTINIDEVIKDKPSIIRRSNESYFPDVPLKINSVNQIRNKKFIRVSYYDHGDPTTNYKWVQNLTEVNVIRSKRITDEFIKVLLENKDKIYLHFEISGMGKTIFEPNIPSVKQSFFGLKKLIDSGFPQNQILVIIKPILQNQNGLNALKLLMRVFSEFSPLRLRYARFELLQYYQDKNGKFCLSNRNIAGRQELRMSGREFLFKSPSFYKDYYTLIQDYKAIIYVDNSEEALIGVRELRPFGYNNTNPDGSSVITYDKGNRAKPKVLLLNGKNPQRCHNKCLLCQYK